MRILLVLAAFLLLISLALAEPAHNFQCTTEFRKTPQAGTVFSNVFVKGKAHYPDGTRLRVSLRHAASGATILSQAAGVSKQLFTCEMGPWDKAFPPGDYEVSIEFRFDDQPPRLKQILEAHSDIHHCIMTDEGYKKHLQETDPEKLREYEAYIARHGVCPGKQQSGRCEFTVGTVQDIERAADHERAFLRERADDALDLLARLRAASSATDVDWVNDWLTDWAEADRQLSRRKAAFVIVERAGLYDRISVAILNLQPLQELVRLEIDGDIAAKKARLAGIEAQPEVTKDERRAAEAIRKEIEKQVGDRVAVERAIVEALADALYGPLGVEPDAERKAAFLKENLR